MVTVVVGASGGIGIATVERLRSEGHHVVGFDRADGIDASDPQAVEAFLSDLGAIDHLVHAAGTTGAGGVEEHDVAMWERVLSDNLTSAFVCVKAALPHLRDGSSIVLSGSTLARTGGNRFSGPAYAASKGGVASFTRFLAKDLAPRGIRVNAIAAGPVDTPMLRRLSPDRVETLVDIIPLRRVATAAEIAGATAFLVGPDAASITGHVLEVNGGMWMG